MNFFINGYLHDSTGRISAAVTQDKDAQAGKKSSGEISLTPPKVRMSQIMILFQL